MKKLICVLFYSSAAFLPYFCQRQHSLLPTPPNPSGLEPKTLLNKFPPEIAFTYLRNSANVAVVLAILLYKSKQSHMYNVYIAHRIFCETS